MTQVVDANKLGHLAVTCLPASWHNTPQKIAPGVRRKIRAGRAAGFADILCLYGDCGTGGELDAVLAQEGVERIAGAHCYEFFAGSQSFAAMMEEELGTFFLTDYLVRHFDRLMIKGLGLDRHPELRDMYFGNYKKVLYLAQVADDARVAKARAAADKLGLAFDMRVTGYGGMTPFLGRAPAVIPAKAGIQTVASNRRDEESLDSRIRGNDRAGVVPRIRAGA